MTLELAMANDVLTVAASHDGEQITLRLEGTADTQSREQFEDYIHRVHDEAQRLGVKTVRVDLRELEFMNSSCLKVFVWWLSQLNELGPDKQYKLVFHSSPKLMWQRRSL